METHYIHVDAVRTALQALTAMTKCGETFEYARPAGLSTIEPKRNVGGAYKTQHCRGIEAVMQAAMRDPVQREAVLAIARSKAFPRDGAP